MKLDREVVYLEKYITKNDYASARTIIEYNLKKLSSPGIRSKLSMEALTFLNCVLELNDGENRDLYSRETQLIIRHINTLAHDCKFVELKNFAFLQKELLSNPKIYDALNEDAKIFIPRPHNQNSSVN